jgi:hypothetical protein
MLTLKNNAAKEEKSLAQYITDRSIVYEETLIPRLIMRTSFISQKSFERDIYRVDVDVDNIKFGRYLLVRRYEVWFSLEKIKDTFKIEGREPGLPELAKFAFDVIRKQFEKTKDNGERVLPLTVTVTNQDGVQATNTRQDCGCF